MEQLVWLLNFIPNLFYHLLLICAILGLIGSNFLIQKTLRQYKLPIQMLFGLILVFAIWMEGVIVRDEMCKGEAQKLQEKINDAEKKSETTNTVIQEKIVEKMKYVYMKGDTIIQKIPVPGKTVEVGVDMSSEEREKFNRKIAEYENMVKTCPTVPKLAIEIHNEAATSLQKEKTK